MAIARIFVYPACDIHLLLSAGANMQVEVLGLHNDNTPNDNLTNNAKTKYLDFNSSIVTVNSTGLFSPVAVGSTIGRIQFTDSSNPANITHEVLTRVFVHDAIDQFWIGNNRASVHQGESNYVLSVFARFTDGTIGDISSHPYLNFSSANPASLSVNNTNDKGRLTGVNAGGPAVPLTVTHNGKSDTINGFVRDPLTGTRSILKRIHGTGNYTDKRNILILPEGFLATQEDKDLFDRVVQEIKHNFFDTNTHSPYDIVKDKFNLWVAYEGGPEPGVTIRNPVTADGTPVPSGYTDAGPCSQDTITLEELIEFVGLPDANAPATFTDIAAKWAGIAGLNLSKINKQLFDLWKSQVIAGITQVKDSFFGLAIGGRFGERLSEDSITPVVKLNKWHANSAPPRHIIPDFRRLGKDLDRTDFLIKYLKTLRFGTDTSNPNFEVFKTWAESPFKDFKLICYILNDSPYGGTNFGTFAISLGSHEKIPVFKSPGHPFKLDHVNNFVSASMDVGEIDPLRLTHAISHEFAHSMKLGDEYEGYDDPAHSQFTNTQENKNRIANFFNLTHFFEVANTTTNKIIADRIRWNWHRIKQVALLITAAADSGSDKVNIRVNPGEGANWQDIKTNGEEVFIRIPGMNTDATDRTKGIDGPFTISAITPGSSGDLIQLKGRTRTVDPNKYPIGSILFLPLKDNDGKILMTIHPSVIAHINSTGEPFQKNTNCAVCHADVSYPPNNIANFTYPTHRFKVIGLYEGGGVFNCKVYRPAGMCQMRDFKFEDNKIKIISTFSFVAKYIIVNQIDPLQLPKLNPLYP